MLLTDKADIYRQQSDPSKAGRTTVRVWRRSVMCHLEPISTVDRTVPFALESTHVVYLPPWFLGLRREDELRIGARFSGVTNDREPRRYIVKGVQRFGGFGLRHTAAYCEERE